ncbi:MAG: DUF362 domain-containing protein [Candidatus Cloacimonadota bacterium]|nr:DUF362 domain-containing protein [Candidatus Cloacimonadota bacterium]
MSKVYIKKTNKPYDLIQLLNKIDTDFKKKTIAFIKPNVVVGAKPKKAIVVEPILVKYLVDFLRGKGIKKIIIGEASGLTIDSNKAMLESGYDIFFDQPDIKSINIDKTEKIHKEWEYGKIKLPKILFGENVLYINVAKLKTHMQSTVTLGLKNQKGIISDTKKKFFHKQGLHKPIVELAKIIKPDLTIIDGILGLEGDGPLYSGHPIKSEILIASKDILSCDIVGAKFMGIDTEKVSHLKYGIQEKIGDPDPQIIGEDLDEIKMNFKRADEEKFTFLKFTNMRNPYACSMCGLSLTETFYRIPKKPKLAITKGPKLAYYFLFKGITFVYGKNPKLPRKTNRRIICFGNCTKELAKEKGWEWIPGCPPKIEDVLKIL